MKQSNQFILNHITPKQPQKTYGIANQILFASSKQPCLGNVVEIVPENPLPNRLCDINDLFKSQICFFTNIYGLEKPQILEQILQNQFFVIIRFLEKEIVFQFNKAKLQSIPQTNNQNSKKNNKKNEKIENPLESFINLLKQVRKEYKEQLDILGKINSFKHPAFINYEFVFPNYEQKKIETPYVSNRVEQNIFEFASYHYFENDPTQILELHLSQLVVALQQSKGNQILYYNDQFILPICGDEEDINFFKTDLKPFRRLLNYKEKFYQIVNEVDGKLVNVHQFLSPKRSIFYILLKVENGQQYLVRGDYVYHHYMQDGFNDKGWGCAYRSFMSVLSWIIENGYSKRCTIPNHQQIQKLLVEMGDKPIEFVNSSEWIGAFEVNMLIHKLTNIECKILNIQKGSDILNKLNEFKQYFIQQGAPIMFGGGLYAYTLLGIDFNEQDCRFLILDPHYVGNDNIKSIIEKGGVQWRQADMFSDENFYNFCMPLVE